MPCSILSLARILLWPTCLSCMTRCTPSWLPGLLLLMLPLVSIRMEQPAVSPPLGCGCLPLRYPHYSSTSITGPQFSNSPMPAFQALTTSAVYRPNITSTILSSLASARIQASMKGRHLSSFWDDLGCSPAPIQSSVLAYFQQNVALCWVTFLTRFILFFTVAGNFKHHESDSGRHTSQAI